jgi:O-antigen/teichoic acid export membrane protein
LYDQLGSRYRRSLLATGAGFLSRGTSLVALMVTMPLTVACLGPERFGLLSTITAGVSLLSFSDLGIGIGLLNLISAAYGRNDAELARRAVASASLALAALAGMVFLIGYPLILSVSWPRILQLHSHIAIAECRPALVTLLALFCIGMPVSVVQRVQMGYQEGFVANAWQAGAGVATLVGTLAAVYLHASLAWFVAAVFGGQTLALAASWIVEFIARRPGLFPRPGYLDFQVGRTIMHSGLLVFSSQAGASALNAAPSIALASVGGAAAVAPFAVLQRVMMVPMAITSAFVAPLWPAYAEAAAVGDAAWIGKTVSRSMALFVALGVIPAAVLAIVRDPLMRFSSHGRLHLAPQLALATAAWMIVVALRVVLSSPVGGCGLLNRVAVAMPVFAALAYAPCFIHSSRGIPFFMVPLATAFCELAVVLVMVRDIRRLFRSMRGAPRDVSSVPCHPA